ncbi:MAG: nucleotide sugar dehydrogenase [Cellulosilyticaceae bacterium]
MSHKICIIGLGYIGLPTAAMFAKYGAHVLGVDVNTKVVEALRCGKVIIEEPFLQELVSEVVDAKRLQVATTPQEADVFIITVPTPILNNKNSDMSYVAAATEAIVDYVRPGNLVILESTSRIGATEEIVKPILEKSGYRIPEDIGLGYCPERVLPGKILEELVQNSRIIGGLNKDCASRIKEVYSTFVKGEMYMTDTRTAEMCKIMENTFRDVNIALANELALLCEKIGINVWEVIDLCNKHPRVNFLSPGPGVGGHCLAVDPWFIVEQYGEIAKLIRTSREMNDSMPKHVLEMINQLLPQRQESHKIAVLGITYKPDIDDVRESPIIELVELLEHQGFEVALVDPYVKCEDYVLQTLEEACKGSDLLVLGVNHSVFDDLPLKVIAELMRGNKVLDTRHSIRENDVVNVGLEYYVLGKSVR